MYNVEKFISTAINSVINQTFDNWELIIVNDGSTDNSRHIASSISKTDSRIRIYDKTNGGLSDARNFGLNRAQGEYIHFFDSDDWISPDYYENFFLKAQECNCDLIISGYTIDSFYENGNHNAWIKELNTDYSNPKDLSNFISGYFNFAWNKLFRRDFLQTIGIYFEKGLKLIEDCEFMSRFVSYNPSISFCNIVGYHYRNDNRKTLSRFYDESLISISSRRILCSSSILKFIEKDQSKRIEALNYIKFNTIRYLIHSLFAYTDSISFRAKRKIISQILSDCNLSMKKDSLSGLSLSEKVLLLSIRHSYTLIIALIYQIKE